ncbi:RNA methyltransferase [Oscillatoria sp. FACHB-1407]|uniref:RNA methyltransferase n=1 Tax=Oscillatoria sp. FACHB-1407 TaxID=2692847 RepID=UPI001688C972|nr:RNA methyltransferase [Oscillatoria sp. FACHB-1407]MBD2460413.1 RNA methyltransferase [Oscillatoria sp. FACHB-1407]
MAETGLSQVRIVLVEPAGALNVGAIARVMKNMGLQRLVLVNPQCDPLGAEARQMAVHAADVLESATRVATLPEALMGVQRAIATTGRDRTTLDITLEHPRTALPWLLPLNSEDELASALIFGREDRGLTNEELNYAQRFIRIPSSADYLSLNLAQAVAICCYELHCFINADPSDLTGSIGRTPPTTWVPHPTHDPNLATLDCLEGYYQQLETLLLKIGYLYPHTAASRMEKFRRLFNRAYLSDGEVAMLRGILSQVEWAIEQGSRE